jgi:hypothetical protein
LLKFLQSNQGIITATSVENLSALVFIVKQIDKEALNLIMRYVLPNILEKYFICSEKLVVTNLCLSVYIYIYLRFFFWLLKLFRQCGMSCFSFYSSIIIFRV